MANLQKVVKATQAQYNTLASGGTVGTYTGLNDNYVYFVEDLGKVINIDNGITALHKEQFLEDNSILICYNGRIYSPAGEYDPPLMEYTNIDAYNNDEIHTLIIDWNNLIIDDTYTVSIGGVQSIKTLDTTATSSQSISSGEEIAGTGTITLHKVSKTGNYNDLLNKPTIPTVNNGILTIQGNGTTASTFTANQSGNTTLNIKGGGNTTVSKTADNEITISSMGGSSTNYYPIRSYTSGLQISTYSGSADCALFVPYAGASQAGVVSTGEQTFSGHKIFQDGCISAVHKWDASGNRRLDIYANALNYYPSTSTAPSTYLTYSFPSESGTLMVENEYNKPWRYHMGSTYGECWYCNAPNSDYNIAIGDSGFTVDVGDIDDQPSALFRVDDTGIYYDSNNNGNPQSIIMTQSQFDTATGGTSPTSTVNPIVDLVYPVGAIYMSTTDATVAAVQARFVGTTWVKIKDRFLLADGDYYNAGDTGGESSHTLTIDEIPSHSHAIRFNGNSTVDLAGDNLAGSGGTWKGVATGQGWNNLTLTSTGGGQSHNNMPPYYVVYMYRRTA